MKRILRLSFLLTLVISLFAAYSFVQAGSVFSNAPFWVTGGPCIGSVQKTATGFTTGATPTTIDYVSTMWQEVVGPTALILTLHADNVGEPGAAIQTIGVHTTTGGNIFVTHTITTTPITLAASTTYWVVATTTSTDLCAMGWGVNNPPLGDFNYAGTRQWDGTTWLARNPVSIEIGEGTPSDAVLGRNNDGQFHPGDDRINHAEVDRAAPVAIYCKPHGIQIRLIDSASGIGIDPPAINIFYEDIEAAGIPTDTNLLLEENSGVSLYRLTTGEFQVNVLDANALEYKWYVFVWDQCSVPQNWYHLDLRS